MPNTLDIFQANVRLAYTLKTYHVRCKISDNITVQINDKKFMTVEWESLFRTLTPLQPEDWRFL